MSLAPHAATRTRPDQLEYLMRRPQRLGALPSAILAVTFAATPMAAAAADVHVKAAYMGTHDRQILLNLDRQARFSDAPTALQTHVRERHVDDLIDAGWRPTMTVAAVSATRTPSSPPRIRFWRALRERRRLALPSARVAASSFFSCSFSRFSRSRARSDFSSSRRSRSISR